MTIIDYTGGTLCKPQQHNPRATYTKTPLARDNDIHIVFVCHPRKSTGFLRKDDISGTADLTNAVDNVVMCHRVNNDFRTKAKDYFDHKTIYDFLENEYTNCIEIMKNRDLGAQDVLIGTYYEPESKRFLNEKYENITYGWYDYRFHNDGDISRL